MLSVLSQTVSCQGELPIALRDYQTDAVARILERYEENPQGHARLVWATGCGKTVGVVAIASNIMERDRRANILVIAHRDELLEQFEQTFRLMIPSESPGMVHGEQAEWGRRITIASIQTLIHHTSQLPSFCGLVIVDECHHALGDNSYGSVLQTLKHAFVLGATATDDMRMDSRSNKDLFGDVISFLPLVPAIEARYLADVRTYTFRFPVSFQLRDVPVGRNGDYQPKRLARSVDTPECNARIVQAFLERASHCQTLVYCINIAHAEHLAEMFRSFGIPSAAVSGETPKDERRQILSDFEQGVLQVVCNCDILSEGYDNKYVSCIILAFFTLSAIKFLQCVGRGTRPALHKQELLLLTPSTDPREAREPQTLARVTGLPVRVGESILEALMRTRRQKESTKRAHSCTQLQIARVTSCQDVARCAQKAVFHQRYQAARLTQALEAYEAIITHPRCWIDVTDAVQLTMKQQHIPLAAIKEVLEVSQPVETYDDQHGSLQHRILVIGESEQLGGRVLAMICRYRTIPERYSQKVCPLLVVKVFEPLPHQWNDTFTRRVCFCPQHRPVSPHEISLSA